MKKQTKLGLVLAAAAVISVSVASLVSARGWVQKGADWFYVDNDGEAITDTIQSSGTAKFYLGADDGAMQKDYFLEDKDGYAYYFGSNGAMVTNTWVAIESSRVDNQQDYVPDNYWYYFQASGKAMKGTQGNPKKTTIDGKKYMFNEYGQMLTGWIDGQGAIVDPDEDDPFIEAVYYAGGDNDGVLRSGWVTYYDGYSSDDPEYLSDKTNIYFYFNPSNNIMVGKQKDGTGDAKTKKINGKTYAFDENGVMLSGWDLQNNKSIIPSLNDKTVYFSGEDDGHQVKKGWVYDVPAESIDTEAHADDEEKYMYFNASGDAVRDQIKKINGKYYVFNPKGVMKTGLVIWYPNANITTSENRYVDKLDLDWATGEDVSKKGTLQTGVSSYIHVDPFGTCTDSTYLGKGFKLHLFGEDGARKTGTNSIEFSDDIFQFCSNSGGDKGSGAFSKKYYSLGILLKASQDIKYGIYATELQASGGTGYNFAGAFNNQYSDYSDGLSGVVSSSDTLFAYQVLTTSGSLQKGGSSAKKDADGNYWFIDKEAGNYLRGIWSVNVKKQKGDVEATKWYEVVDGGLELTNIMFDSSIEDPALSDVTSGLGVDVTAADTLFQASQYHAKGAADGPDNVKAQIESVKISATDVRKDSTGAITHVYVKLKATMKEGTFWYQSDYNGSSNKWIPFGWKDDASKTASIKYDSENPVAVYQVTPNTDYFLNCWWKKV